MRESGQRTLGSAPVAAGSTSSPPLEARRPAGTNDNGKREEMGGPLADTDTYLGRGGEDLDTTLGAAPDAAPTAPVKSYVNSGARSLW